MALAHPTLKQEAREAIACDYFVDAMDDPDFALKICERAPPIIIIIMKFISDRMSIEKQYKAVTRNTNTQHTHTKISSKTAEMLNYSISRYGAVVFK